MLGCGEDCDFILPPRFEISPQHCAMTFDEKGHLIIQDLGSRNGIIVSYNGINYGRRRGFTWIIGGHDIANTQTITLEFSEFLKFRIAVTKHDISSYSYIHQVHSFRQCISEKKSLIAKKTQASLAPTRWLSTTPVLLSRLIGSGTYGEVLHVWNASTGIEYALKRPSIQTSDLNYEVWRSEAQMLEGLVHVCVLLPTDSISNDYDRII